MEFDGLLRSNFLELYNCVIDFNKNLLVTNFKTILFLKITDTTKMPNKTERTTPNINVNAANIESGTEKICKLKCNFRSTNALLVTKVQETVLVSNALVR